MTRHILIIDGHPDPSPERFVHALADAYREGAESNRHEVMVLRVAELEFPLLRTQVDYEKGEPSDTIRRCQGLRTKHPSLRGFPARPGDADRQHRQLVEADTAGLPETTAAVGTACQIALYEAGVVTSNRFLIRGSAESLRASRSRGSTSQRSRSTYGVPRMASAASQVKHFVRPITDPSFIGDAT